MITAANIFQAVAELTFRLWESQYNRKWYIFENSVGEETAKRHGPYDTKEIAEVKLSEELVKLLKEKIYVRPLSVSE